MTIFEYLMVMVSIILGLSITQVLRGLSKIARSPRRSVAATLYGVFLFALHVQTWWALWDLSVVPEWNFLLFILLISIPSILFATTETLFPMATTAETDWNAHYEAVRKLFLSVLALWTILALLETRIFLGTPLTHPYRIVQVSILGLIVARMVPGGVLALSGASAADLNGAIVWGGEAPEATLRSFAADAEEAGAPFLLLLGPDLAEPLAPLARELGLVHATEFPIM